MSADDRTQLKAQAISLLDLLKAEYATDYVLGSAVYEMTIKGPRTFDLFMKDVESNLGKLLMAELRPKESVASALWAVEKDVKEMEKLLHVLTKMRSKFSLPLAEVMKREEYVQWEEKFKREIIARATGSIISYTSDLFFYLTPLAMADESIRETITGKKRPPSLSDEEIKKSHKKPRLSSVKHE
jgi:hypothetical protein